MPYVARPVDVGPADVHQHFLALQGYELFFASTQGVVYSEGHLNRSLPVVMIGLLPGIPRETASRRTDAFGHHHDEKEA